MRVLLCVGCNRYANASQLTGAEGDAQRMFDSLIHKDRGDYDVLTSQLLLSPSLSEVRKALFEVLFKLNTGVDTFTFYFAGHGAVQAGSFYLCLQDAVPEALSMTALSLGELLRAVNNAAPTQTNIIMDACNSGGLIKDLGTLLTADGMGETASPGVTLVATSAMDQYSYETANGGFGTNAILDCIEGRVVVNDRSPTLDLFEIARRIKEVHTWPDQSIVASGINLMELPRFCKNPKFQINPSPSFHEVVKSWPSATGRIQRKHYDALLLAYSGVNQSFHPRKFLDGIEPVFSELEANADYLAAVLNRLAISMQERARESNDAFRPTLVLSSFAVSLLPYQGSVEICAVIERLLLRVGEEILSAGAQLMEDLKEYRFNLLSSRGASSDLFYLPIRIASVLGWLGCATFLLQKGSAEESLARNLFLQAHELIVELYADSILAISDCQSSSWCLAIATLIALDEREKAEELIGTLFYSVVQSHGVLARSDIPSDKVLDFILARSDGNYELVNDLLERPIETLSVLFLAANELGLGEVWDTSLWKLDGVSFSAFVPSSYEGYGRASISEGRNLTWTIGFDVFRVGDFAKGWVNDVALPATSLELKLVTLAALLFQDRVPWFLFAERG